MAASTSPIIPKVMLSVPEKRTSSLDLYTPLRRYICSAYSERDAQTAEDDLSSLNRMRAAVERSPPGSLTSRRDLLQSYYKALCVVEARFPISPDKVHIDSVWFTWWDAFKPRSKAAERNVSLEKAALLFNLGSVWCEIGLGCDRTVVEGRREASHSFLAAAGVFAFLRENESGKASMGSSATVDISKDCAQMLEWLMLAQAQECVFENSVAKGTSAGVRGKIARQVGIYYEEVLAALDAAPLNQHVDKGWVSHLQVKAALFYAEACYTYSLELHDKEQIGEEIARLRSGIAALSEAKKSSRGVSSQLLGAVEELERIMNLNLEIALKENDKVYLLRVPSPKLLPPLPAVSLVKSMPMKAALDASKEKLFSSLVPDTIAKALSRYTEMVDDIIKAQVEKLQLASELRRIRLKEMDLPGSLVAIDGSFSLPQDLKENVEVIQTSGGSASLEVELQQLRDFRGVNQELLLQAEELLQKEAKEDDQLRNQYGTQWIRPPSNNLTKNLKERLNKFAENLRQAADSDAKIERSLMDNATVMSILDYHPIESAFPALARPIMSLYVNEDALVETLHQSLKQLESIGDHLASFEETLKDVKNKDDILPKLMSFTGSYEDLFRREICKYEKISEQIIKNTEAQEQLLQQIQAQNDKFSTTFDLEPYKASQDNCCKQIQSAIEKYREVKANLSEGIKFYVTLQDAINNVKQQCSDFVMTRNIQCQEMVEAVRRNISGLFFQENIYHNATQQNQAPSPQHSSPPGGASRPPQHSSPPGAPSSRPPGPTSNPQTRQPGAFPRPPYTIPPYTTTPRQNGYHKKQ